MRYTCRIAVAALLSISAPAIAQLPTLGFSGGGGGTRDGGFRGNATFQLPLRWLPLLQGAPYSAEQVDERTQTLPDGTHVTSQVGFHMKAWRDSQGRIRLERPFFSGPIPPSSSAPVLAEIQDPMAGYIYILDNLHKVAHRIKMPSPSPVRPSSLPPSTSARAGSLGTQLIDGVEAYGTRTGTVTPAGTVGNDAPLTTAHEQWFAPELQLTLLTIDTDPRQGTTTHKVINLSRIEPDPALFYVPVGYTVVDEKETFTIQWGEY